MSKGLVYKEFSELKWKLVLGFVAILILTLSVIVLYEQLAALLTESLGEMPAIFADAFSGFTDYTNAMFSNLNDKNMPQVGSVLAIFMGIGLIAPEIESGSITLLLTNGLSRRRIFRTKALIALIAIWLMFISVGLTVIPLSSLFGHTLRHGRIIGATVVTAIGLGFVLAVSLLVSTIVKEKLWSGITSAAIFAVWSVVGYFKSVRVLSPFYHMRARDYYYGISAFPWVTVAVFLLATLMVMWLAEQRFLREEL